MSAPISKKPGEHAPKSKTNDIMLMTFITISFFRIPGRDLRICIINKIYVTNATQFH
jgi:hypothetical protein